MKSLNIEEATDEESANLLINSNSKSIPNDAVSAITPVEYDKVMLGEFALSFFGLLISYVTWGIMQELIMNTQFNPSAMVPSGMFPSCKLYALCYMFYGTELLIRVFNIIAGVYIFIFIYYNFKNNGCIYSMYFP